MEKQNKNIIFIEKAIAIHGDKYDYSLVEYINSSSKVDILCRLHGKFTQHQNNHVHGKGCPKCANLNRGSHLKSNLDIFIEKAKEKHGDIYNYDKVEYLDCRDKVIINCTLHGDFKQTPILHLKGNGCYKCGNIKKGLLGRLTISNFIERANLIHNNFYSYKKVIYEGTQNKVTIICPIHGEYLQTPNSHLAGHSCPMCGSIKKGLSGRISIDNFIERSNKIHNNKYSYNKSVYVNMDTKIVITCPIHNDFSQIAASHVRGSGCIYCFIEDSGFTKTDFKNRSKGRECTFYIIRCWNENEQFYKIGITSMGVQKRFKNKKLLPYNYEIVYQYVDEPEKIYDLEKVAHRSSKNYKYKPLIKFAGYTECFTKDLQIEKLNKNG